MCPENAIRDSQPISGDSLFEAFNQWFGQRWRCSTGEAGSAATTNISIKGKLRDHEQFSSNIEKRTIHLALVVSKDAHVDNFIGQGFNLGLTIVLAYAEEYQQTCTYLADDLLIDGDAGVGDAL